MEPVNKHKRTMHLLFGKQRPGRGENAEKNAEKRKNADRFYFPPLHTALHGFRSGRLQTGHPVTTMIRRAVSLIASGVARSCGDSMRIKGCVRVIFHPLWDVDHPNIHAFWASIGVLG